MSSPKPSSLMFPASSSSGNTGNTNNGSSSLVKYCGRSMVVSTKDADYKSVVQRLLSLTQDLQQNGSYRSDADWNNFFADLSAFTNHIINPEVQLQRYQVDLISDSLLPYITKLKGRFYTDKARVRQLSDIMHALSNTEPHHPAITLLALENVRCDVQGKQTYFWKSELLSILDTAMAKQWRPILFDMKTLLYDVAGKLIGFGLIGVIGWPLVFAGPILMNAEKLLKVLKEWETRRRVSPQSIFEVVKILVMMFALLQIMSIVQMYQSLGMLSIVIGAVAFALTLQEAAMKQIAPMFASHAVVYDRYVHVFNSLDYNDAIGLWKKLVTSPNLADIDANHIPSHPQVEEVLQPAVQVTPVKHSAAGLHSVSPIPLHDESCPTPSSTDSREGHNDSDYVMLDSDVDPDPAHDVSDEQLLGNGMRQRKGAHQAASATS